MMVWKGFLLIPTRPCHLSCDGGDGCGVVSDSGDGCDVVTDGG